MERTCKKCGETKPIEEFVNDSKCKYGHSYACKICGTNKNKLYYKLHEKELSIKRRIYKYNHKKERREYNILYNENHKKELQLKRKLKKESHSEYCKLYYKLHMIKIKSFSQLYREKNKDRAIESNRISRMKNKDYYNLTHRNRTHNLADNYIIQNIYLSTGLNKKAIKQHPELIENYRHQIKIKRLLKQKKNENNETS